MSQDEAANLWYNIRERNKIMNIAEKIAHIYKNRHLDTQGRKIRYISVKTVDFTIRQYAETIQYDTSIEFLSDLESWIQPVIIREFTSDYTFNRELEHYEKLEQRCLLFPGIEVLNLIYIDSESKMVIYEGSNGKMINNIRIPENLRDFQLGVLGPIIQGVELRSIDITETRDLCKYLMQVLPFNDEDKQHLEPLLEKHLIYAASSSGGYEPITVFDTQLFYVDDLVSITELSKSKIFDGTAMNIQVELVQPQGECYDRMGDLATIYSKDAYLEYIQFRNVNHTLNKILCYLEGFEMHYSNTIGSPFDAMYPYGLSLDLQMLIGYWILAFDALINERDTTTMLDNLTNYSYFLLKEEPFKMYERRKLMTQT